MNVNKYVAGVSLGLLLVLVIFVFRHEYMFTRVVGGSSQSGALANINKRLDDLADKVTKLLAGAGQVSTMTMVETEADTEADTPSLASPGEPVYHDWKVSPEGLAQGKITQDATVDLRPHAPCACHPLAQACPEQGRGACPACLPEPCRRREPKVELPPAPSSAPKPQPKVELKAQPKAQPEARPCPPALRGSTDYGKIEVVSLLRRVRGQDVQTVVEYNLCRKGWREERQMVFSYGPISKQAILDTIAIDHPGWEVLAKW